VVVDQGLVAVDVDDCGWATIRRYERRRIDRDLTLLEVPVGPHRLVRGDTSVGLADVQAARQAEPLPDRCDPRADGDDDLLDLDRAGARLHRGHGVRAVEPEPRDLDAAEDLRAGAACLLGEAEHRLAGGNTVRRG
jgi:hypothetical protein